MEYELSDLDVAKIQLSGAIKLFLEESNYVCAITLAGAAEEILSKRIGTNSAHNKLKKALAPQFDLTEKDFSDQYLNRAKILLKHWKTTGQENPESLDAETEAIQYIIRALVNMISAKNSITALAIPFIDWVIANKPDIFPEDFQTNWPREKSRLLST